MRHLDETRKGDIHGYIKSKTLKGDNNMRH